MTSEQVDVIVVGGGMVGMSLAAELVAAGLEVAVVERDEPAPYDPAQPHDLRVSAVSPASRGFLDAIGAWPRLAAMRLCPYRRMRVWDRAGHGQTRFDAADIGEPVLGYIAENRLIRLAIWQQATAADNLRLHLGSAADDLLVDDAGVTLSLANGTRLRGRLLVGADGANSWVRRQAQIGDTAWDYDQHALVLSVRTEYPQQDITWQRFTPTGPEAFLPLPGPHASLVWYHDPHAVARMLSMPDGALLDALHQQFPPELGRVEDIAARGSFSIRRMHAHDYVQPRIALAGDAAHTIHPLAGQGVNLGFMDAAALGAVIRGAAERGEDIGALRVLRRYERARKGDNLAVQTAMDLFHRGFRPQEWPLRLARNLGLDLVDRLPPLRQTVERLASGRRRSLPVSSRGARA
ncbi:MAG: UbiH/UbiF/VisC/COQ6 family ubiquinone biosynthesis hydroxylase [Halothiobacillaceae bacterium]